MAAIERTADEQHLAPFDAPDGPRPTNREPPFDADDPGDPEGWTRGRTGAVLEWVRSDLNAFPGALVVVLLNARLLWSVSVGWG